MEHSVLYCRIKMQKPEVLDENVTDKLVETRLFVTLNFCVHNITYIIIVFADALSRICVDSVTDFKGIDKYRYKITLNVCRCLQRFNFLCDLFSHGCIDFVIQQKTQYVYGMQLFKMYKVKKLGLVFNFRILFTLH